MNSASIGSVELAFETEALRKICEDEEAATQELGAAVADVLKHRLADLSAALSPMDLLVGSPRPSPVNTEQLVIDLSDGYYMSLAANHPKNPTGRDGLIKWDLVRRMRLIEIGRKND